MAKNAAIALGLGLGLGTIGAAIFFSTREKAAPEETPYVPTTDDIMSSGTMAELEVYFIINGQMLVTNQIDRATYRTLYDAYVTRFYELRGWQQ